MKKNVIYVLIYSSFDEINRELKQTCLNVFFDKNLATDRLKKAFYERYDYLFRKGEEVIDKETDFDNNHLQIFGETFTEDFQVIEKRVTLYL